jgi:fermentation-respiration switch protein FrsA (DUF1100 family)
MPEGAEKPPKPDSPPAAKPRRSLARRILVSALRILVISYVLVLLLIYFFQSRLVFMPYRKLEGTPAQAGILHEEVSLTAADGVRLHAWFAPAPGPLEPRGTVLFCHGNAGNISHRIENLRKMRSLGLSVLLFDYRGYGRSEGSPSEEGTYLDARAGWDWLANEKRIPADRVIVWGQSLGGAVASHLAAEVAPGALILESTFTSLPDVGADLYPFLPARWLARMRYDSLGNLQRVRCPVLVIHSRQDEQLRFAYAQRLFAAAPEPKEFLEISGGHNEGFLTSGRTYTDGINGFLKRHLPAEPQPANGR